MAKPPRTPRPVKRAVNAKDSAVRGRALKPAKGAGMRPDRDLAVLDADLQPVAVPFDLVNPSISGRHVGPQGRQARPDESRHGLVWTEPQLVAEVDYRGWTADEQLRHASFKGLREDKEARSVVREANGA